MYYLVDENVENWTDIDDDEIAQVFLTQDEVAMKTELWEENNRDYIEKMAGKCLLDGTNV